MHKKLRCQLVVSYFDQCIEISGCICNLKLIASLHERIKMRNYKQLHKIEQKRAANTLNQ